MKLGMNLNKKPNIVGKSSKTKSPKFICCYPGEWADASQERVILVKKNNTRKKLHWINIETAQEIIQTELHRRNYDQIQLHQILCTILLVTKIYFDKYFTEIGKKSTWIWLELVIKKLLIIFNQNKNSKNFFNF